MHAHMHTIYTLNFYEERGFNTDICRLFIYGNIRIIYNDSRGLSINAEDTLRNFISQITKTQSDVNVADIKLKQQKNGKTKIACS